MSQLPSNAGALVGKRLGKYEILALLALGGTAEIYLARVVGVAGFEKYVVVKCLHDHLADDTEFVQMFLDEARLGAKLDHSNIVQTLELGEENDRYYMVMEYLTGMSLSLIVRKVGERVQDGRIPVDLVLGLAAQACAGLHYAHQRTDSGGDPLGVVHRDISPQNLVVTFEGILKLVDFGIAKATVRDTKTKSGTIKGKFAYMSPEQCLAESDVDRRTDVFALGTVVHELLTGQRLFKRQSTYDTYHAILDCNVPPPSTINKSLDPRLDPVVLKALEKERDKRYQTAEAFGDALTTALHKRGKSVSPGSISTFFDQHFNKEIQEHAQRMRALIAGRTSTVDEKWDEGDESDLAASGEGSGSRDRAATLDERAALAQAKAGSAGAALAGRDEEGDEPTRIELNPLERAKNLHDSGTAPAQRGPERRPATKPAANPATPAAKPARPAAKPAPGQRARIPTDADSEDGPTLALDGGGPTLSLDTGSARAIARTAKDTEDAPTLALDTAGQPTLALDTKGGSGASGAAGGPGAAATDDERKRTLMYGSADHVRQAVAEAASAARKASASAPTEDDDVDDEAATLVPGRHTAAELAAKMSEALGAAQPAEGARAKLSVAGYDDKTLVPGDNSLDVLRAAFAGGAAPSPGSDGASAARTGMPGAAGGAGNPEELTDLTSELEEASMTGAAPAPRPGDASGSAPADAIGAGMSPAPSSEPARGPGGPGYGAGGPGGPGPGGQGFSPGGPGGPGGPGMGGYGPGGPGGPGYGPGPGGPGYGPGPGGPGYGPGGPGMGYGPGGPGMAGYGPGPAGYPGAYGYPGGSHVVTTGSNRSLAKRRGSSPIVLALVFVLMAGVGLGATLLIAKLL